MYHEAFQLLPILIYRLFKGNWHPPVGNPFGKAASRLVPFLGAGLLAYDVYNLYNEWYTPRQRVPNPTGRYALPAGHNWRKLAWSDDNPEGDWLLEDSFGGASKSYAIAT